MSTRQGNQSWLAFTVVVVLGVAGIIWGLTSFQPAPDDLIDKGQNVVDNQPKTDDEENQSDEEKQSIDAGDEKSGAANKLPQDARAESLNNDGYFELAIDALSATEEAQFRRALDLWKQLIELKPEQNALKLNQAITVLKWIDQTNGRISSGQTDAEETQKLNAELDEAYTLVESVLATMRESKIDDFRAAYVEAALLKRKSQKLPSNESLAMRKLAADILVERLSKEPGNMLLACEFDDLCAELERSHPELTKLNADYLLASFQSQPRNLFLLSRACDVLLGQQDARLSDLLDPSLELSAPMLDSPAIARTIERLKPTELVGKAKELIAQGDWNGLKRLRLQGWFNMFKGMSPAFQSDSKLAKPDVLALLETRFLDPLLSSASVNASSPPTYNTQDLLESKVAIWYDFDADLDFDVVSASGETLSFWELADNRFSLTEKHTISLGFEINGLLAVDLFEVDLPSRPKLPTSVDELMNSEPDSGILSREAINRANRHDTLLELLVWDADGIRIVSYRDDKFDLLSEATGLERLANTNSIVPFDIESDGDLDLAILTDDGMRILQNNGNRTFKDISTYSLLPDNCVQAVLCDFDRDTDQDLFVMDPTKTQPQFLENILHGQFRLRELEGDQWKLAESASSLAIADWDGNGTWDLISTGPSGSVITQTRPLADNGFAASNRIEIGTSGESLRIEDINNDSFLDLVTTGPTGVHWQGSDSPICFAGAPISELGCIDCNGDGALDFLSVGSGIASIALCEPIAGNDFLLARVRGINDINGGGRINHYCVGTTLEVWADQRLLSRVVTQPVTHFGLAQLAPKNLRIVFTNGLTQNVQSLSANQLVEEKQVLRGSCPYVYGWDGKQFQLITDLLWNAPLGLQIARGQVMPDRRWEYLLLPGEYLQPREGAYDLRVTEELWEVAYFDQIELTAIDHPADVEIFTNEKVGPPSIAEPRLFAVRDRYYPNKARDTFGRSVVEQLSQRDRRYVQAFEHQICQGLCEPHYIELDFGLQDSGKPTLQSGMRLFLTGWMFPTDTSLNIGIDQNPNRNLPEAPSLWVVDEDGKWVCVRAMMGFPGGKPKSIVIDLEGVFRSQDRRIRIASSQQIYWDEAFVAKPIDEELRQQQELQEQKLSLVSATLDYRGFSKLLPREPDQPHWFDYQSVSTEPLWPALTGPFTRFGDVASLLAQDDDRLVVMASGDEIVLKFQEPRQLPEGWKRDFVMHNIGWDKDADVNTYEGQGSLPLPFKAQQSYPAPPEQSAEELEVWEKNAPTLTRPSQVNSQPSYRVSK